ncbi:GNAT family N-acetyltransferase [Streptomyces sp. NPDC088124]|uniref:GNAT family N-acetyltransferase n=1 Tax=Streptomyces sp. NPDC088124 TaxID=3154654 RepID=UPI0034380B1C
MSEDPAVGHPESGHLPPRTELRGHGLRLRAWRTGDEATLVRGLTDPEFLRWNSPLVHVTTEAEASRLIQRREDGWARGTMANFCVTEDAGEDADGRDGVILGHVGLGVLDLRLRVGRVGYWVLPEARGRGVAGRALDLCGRWAFEQAGVHRIELGHAVGHAASCRIAERGGYRGEGILRDATLQPGGTFRDVHLHARLATDPAPLR